MLWPWFFVCIAHQMYAQHCQLWKPAYGNLRIDTTDKYKCIDIWLFIHFCCMEIFAKTFANINCVHLFANGHFVHNELYLSSVAIKAYHLLPYMYQQLSSTFQPCWQILLENIPTGSDFFVFLSSGFVTIILAWD